MRGTHLMYVRAAQMGQNLDEKRGFVVYSMAGCRHCDYVKLLLHDYDKTFIVRNIEDLKERAVLRKRYNMDSFPIILKEDGGLIGGFFELNRYLIHTPAMGR